MPEEAASSGAPRGQVRIGVIDSGVNPRHPHIASLAGAIAIGQHGDIREDSDSCLDRLGHGTAVLAAIQEKAPDASCYAVRVFHDALRTKASTLVRAIEWCVDQEMDLVNLSLGTVNPAHRDALAVAAERACAAGSLLVAAREADGALCYPGALPSVLSVGLDWDCPRDRYRIEAAGTADIFYASGFPRPAPGVAPARNLYGISFAVANMTGFAARACQSVSMPRRDPQRIALIRSAMLAGAKTGGC